MADSIKSSEAIISVVIPIINAAGYLPELLTRLMKQQPGPPDEIILVDSGSRDASLTVAAACPIARVININNFSHGRSRNLGVQSALGDIIVLMTQDALPCDDNWLHALLQPFDDSEVAAVFSRQVPRPGAPPTEKFFLNYHFPAAPLRRWQADISAPLKFAQDVFFSNVSAAIRRQCLQAHPFDEKLIMSEDQQLARDLLSAGHAICYQPASVVIHSHSYGLWTAFRRYFDSVHSLTVIFPRHNMRASATLGLKYLLRETWFIIRNYPWYFPYYIFYTMAKAGGTIMGHYAGRLPRRVTRLCSLHRYHWDEQRYD